MSSSYSQFRQVLRRLAKTPIFGIVTVLTLAVAIGANTAIFSVINGVLIKPLPYPDPDRLVSIWHTAPGINLPEINACPATYFTYREEGRAFEDSGIWRTDDVTVTGFAEPERVIALEVTDGVLPILGIQPVLGRWFTRKDASPGSPETALLTHGYWQSRFGGDRSVLGRRILLDGRAVEVIGVLPASFRWFVDRHPSLIMPLQFDRAKIFLGEFSYQGVARLKPGVSLAQANADIGRMIPMLTRNWPPPPGMSMKMIEDARIGPKVRPLKEDAIGDVGRTLWVLMATVGLVLLIACANVANLLLVRAEGRQHELAIRTALGASPGTIARELLFESTALGLMGGAAGCGLAYAALKLLVKLAPAQLPRLEEITLDARVVLFAFGLSLLSGVLFGLLPVFKYARLRAAGGLHEGGRTASSGRERHRARSILVVAQVALALVLLVSSGLLMRTLQALRHVDPGFKDPWQVQTVRVSIPDAAVPDDNRVARIHHDILERIAAIPGVTSVGATNSITMDGWHNNDPIMVEDQPVAEGKLPPLRRYKYVTPGFFQTMGNRVIAGRDVTWTDIFDKRKYVLVSENLAREYWKEPGKAIGKRIRQTLTAPWREIIGVVGNEYDDGVDQKPTSTVYWPLLVADFWQMPTRVERGPAYVIRTPRAGTTALRKDIEQAVWSINRDLPLANVRTVGEIYSRSMARTSFTLLLLALASGMALLLGIVGIYGVISYAVSQRTREIGIRIALGAPGGTVRAMFVRHGLILAGTGAVIGILTAALVTRVLTALLFGVKPLDPVTYGGVAVLLTGAALLASYLPARRATAIQPVEALRTE